MNPSSLQQAHVAAADGTWPPVVDPWSWAGSTAPGVTPEHRAHADLWQRARLQTTRFERLAFDVNHVAITLAMGRGADGDAAAMQSLRMLAAEMAVEIDGWHALVDVVAARQLAGHAHIADTAVLLDALAELSARALPVIEALDAPRIDAVPGMLRHSVMALRDRLAALCRGEPWAPRSTVPLQDLRSTVDGGTAPLSIQATRAPSNTATTIA